MKRYALITALLFLGALGTLSQKALAHGGYPEDVKPAAHQFETDVRHFHTVIHQLTGYSHLAQDIHGLADSAKHFHHSVEQGATYEHALQDFQKIRQAYRHASRAFYQAHGTHHNPHVIQDWYRVEYAFEELEWAMGF